MHPVARSVAVLTGLAGLNVAAQRSRLDPDLVVPVGAATMLAAARASGLSWEELGLGRSQARRGLVTALGWASVTVGGVALAASHPSTAPFFADARHPTSTAARRAALVRIPLAVAIPEEILFRSVLDASLRRHLSGGGATAAGAAAFGAWHILGATAITQGNDGLTRSLGGARFRTAVAVVGTVVATGIAGVGFIALRRRSGSVLPAIAVHWALNGAGALAAGSSQPATHPPSLRAAYSGGDDWPAD